MIAHAMKPESLPIFNATKAAVPVLTGLPFLRLGFRPFYLGGAALAALSVPLWVAMFMGQVTLAPNPPAFLWHAHEMLFGFAVAIIVGFLMTAGRNWTGLPTPRGPALAALALLWFAARLASVAGPYWLYAVLDVALLPMVAGILARLLLRAGNHRNLPLAGLLALLALANLAFHLSVSAVVQLSPLSPLYAALALIVMIECVMAGRVIPMFTMNVTPGLRLTSTPWVERLTLATTGLALALWVLAPPGVVTLVVLLAASVLQAKRWLGWQPWVSRGRPVLWILHGAYGWIPVGLALLALAQTGVVTASVGVHALAVGATGGLIIGMMSRTARGHTGRPIAASRPEVLAFGLVMTAAVLRVVVPALLPWLYGASLVAASAAWSVAFLIYLKTFTPWLLQTRLDGKDG